MINATNPLLIKQEFMAKLKKTNQDTASVDALVKYFYEISWWLDNEQLECFGELKKFMLSLPIDIKKAQIPKLIDVSMYYPRLILLAEELFYSFDETEQKQIKIPMIFWTFDDTYTLISSNEYRYRKAYGKSVWVEDGSYRRPVQKFDLVCYGKVLEMIVKSQSSTVII